MADLVSWSDPLILGSGSPRRSELLRRLGVPFVVEIRQIDESVPGAGHDTAADASLAIAKAKFAAFESSNPPQQTSTVLTADTLVSCNGRVMGKPESNRDVAEMLHYMSGQTIIISTAMCAGPSDRLPRCEVATTRVDLRVLSDADIAIYATSDVGLDKAGGLALQSEAAGFIESVDGCWSNVLGLAVCVVAGLLRESCNEISSADRCSRALCGSPRPANGTS